MSELIHFLNGKFVAEEKLLISPRDLGFVRGYAVNDYIVTFHHKPFKVPEHIDRLFRSAAIYNLQIPWSKEQVISWVYETLEKNDKESEKTLKIILSGGVSSSMYQAATPTILMIVNHYVEKPLEYYENGVKAKAINYKRPFPQAKHTYHAAAIRELAQVHNEGITEIIYYDSSQVFEAGGSNIFAVIDRKLVTPKSNIVEWLIRNTLLEILTLDIPIEVKDFPYHELLTASEVFITNSRNGSIGVVAINGQKIGDGKVGETTKEIAGQYEKWISHLAGE
jgi:branched-chain amino acid aminotransferase